MKRSKAGSKFLGRQGGAETRIRAEVGVAGRNFLHPCVCPEITADGTSSAASPIHHRKWDRARCSSSASMAAFLERLLINHQKLMIKKLIRVFSSINL